MRLLLIIFFISMPIFAYASQCNGTNQNPCLVEDTTNNQIKLKNFRAAPEIAKVYHGNISGLTDLWLSGSSASSQKDWVSIYQEIQKASQHKVKHIIDVDLRQESHGYLNNNAINLTSKSNWLNINKQHNKVLRDEHHWLQSLKNLKTIKVLEPNQFKTNQFNTSKKIVVQTVQDEKTVVEKIGFKYFRLTIPDHRAPSDVEVDRFISLVKTLPQESWLHIHCRGGDGRTTTFMAMYDMLRNANKVSFDEIIKRQAAVKPFYDLSQVKRKHAEYIPYYQARLAFLTEFYRYAIDYLHGYEGTWSNWKSTHNDIE